MFMKKVEYNIEFAHIYSEGRFSLEQRTSFKILNKTIERLKKENKTYVTAILIDDYQPSYSYLDICAFLESVKELGVPPSYIAYESQLHSLANKLLASIDEKHIIKEKTDIKIKSNKDTLLLSKGSVSSISLKDEFFAKLDDYIETNVLIAAWYLVRLGIFNKPGLIKETKYTRKIPFAGENILTIIPRKYIHVDESAKTILKYCGYGHLLDRIHVVTF